MKKSNLILPFCLTIFNLACASNPMVTPAFQLAIKTTDLNQTAEYTQAMYTINRSGRYYLAQNLLVSPVNDTVTVIRISASNVILDLNSKTIVRNGDSSTGTNLIAIESYGSVSNIVVMNGFIQGDNHNNQYISVGLNFSSCSLVQISQLQINQCQSNGIVLNSCQDLKLLDCCSNNASGVNPLNGLHVYNCQNVTVERCNFNNNLTTYGDLACIYFDSSGSIIFNDCNVNSNTSYGGNSTGFYFTSCQDILLTNCKSINNYSTIQATGIILGNSTNSHLINSDFSNQTGASAFSAVFSNSKNCLVEKCLANNNNAYDGTSGGFFLNGSPSNIFLNCSASHQRATNGNPAGFWIEEQSHNCILKNCDLSNNATISDSQSVYGAYILNSSNHLLENCEFNQNSSTNGNSFGLVLNNSNNSYITSCEMNGNIASESGGFYGDAYGVSMVNSSNNYFNQCIAQRNQVAGTGNSAIGFFSSAGYNNSFEKCIANGQTCLDFGIAAGFMFAAAETNSQIVNCEASANNAGDSTGSLAYGIFLNGSAGDILNCYIKENRLINNTATNDSARRYGFYDSSTEITSILLKNLSVGQGPCLVSSTLNSSNQFIDYQFEGMNYYFNQPGDGTDPRFMISEAPVYNLTSISTSVAGWENISLY